MSKQLGRAARNEAGKIRSPRYHSRKSGDLFGATYAIKLYKIVDEPQTVDCDTILYHPCNRGKQPPNMMYVHQTLIPNIMTQGFDPSRPTAGFLVQHKDHTKKQAVLEYNMKQAEKNPSAYPPIVHDKFAYSCAASNHLTLAFRCMRHNVKSNVTGRTASIPDDDLKLAAAVTHGHKYWILSDEITDAELTLLSKWRNADQDQNQMSSENEMIRQVTTICQAEMKVCTQVKIGAVISAYTADSIVKVNTNALASIVKWVLSMGAGIFVQEFLDWQVINVNPADLTCTPQWYEDLSLKFSKTFPLIKLAACKIQYSGDIVSTNVRPLPDVCRMLSVPELANAAKQDAMCEEVEKMIRETRQNIEPKLVTKLGNAAARDVTCQFELQLVRMLFKKSAHKHFHPGVVGNLDVDKIVHMRAAWLRWVERGNELLKGLCVELGIDAGDVNDPSVLDEVASSAHVHSLTM
jgi:hypothetical protein